MQINFDENNAKDIRRAIRVLEKALVDLTSTRPLKTFDPTPVCFGCDPGALFDFEKVVDTRCNEHTEPKSRKERPNVNTSFFDTI